MILPLSHCHALGCDRLVDPGIFMCKQHEKLISSGILLGLAYATSVTDRLRAEACALVEVAEKEGLLHD